MEDIDSFLLKCTLEAISNGTKPEEILTICECQMGFAPELCEDDINNHQLIQGEQSC